MIITLTGPVGAGKDTVLSLLKVPSSYTVLNADVLGHELLKRKDIIKGIKALFPAAIMNDQVDRKTLGQLIFPRHLAQFNALVHPALIKLIHENIKPKTIIHAALLKELKLKSISDKVILVDASWASICKRTRHKLSLKDLRKRRSSQPSLVWYRKHADIIIKNNGRLDDLRQAIESQCQDLF